MYKTIAEAKAFAETFKKKYQPSDVRVAICAPYLPVSYTHLFGTRQGDFRKGRAGRRQAAASGRCSLREGISKRYGICHI